MSEREPEIEAALKTMEARASEPLGPRFSLRGIHTMRDGEGDPRTLYFGNHRGAAYVCLDWRGFNGWTSSPTWMRGGWEFYEPTFYWGRLFSSGLGGHRSFGRVLIPAKLVSRLRWATSAKWRRLMRERPEQAR